MKQDLLGYLVCPRCARSFAFDFKKIKNGEVMEGLLVCSKGHRFLIKNGIPRLVYDKSSGFVKTTKAFSAKWKNYNKSLHAKKWYNFQKNWFLERFGWKSLANFNKFLKTRKFILDAGTGIGNSAKLFSSNPQAQVFAIDASESIDFAYRKYGNTSNIHFIQADLRNLPFKKKFFDFICSDQVLHHTDNTRSAFRNLTTHLQKKGLISIYVYKKKSPIREFTDDFIREYTTKMSEKECMEFSKDMAYLGKTLSNLKSKITIKRDISLLGIKKGIYDVQRFVYWNFIKCFWSDDGNFERSVGVNFDWYYPRYAFRHTPEEVRKWYKESRLKVIHFNEIESGISVSGIKS